LDKANLPHQPTTAIGHLNRRWKEIQHDRHIEQFGFTHDDEKLEIKSDSQHNTIQNDDGGVMLRANIMYGDKTDIKDEIDQEFALLDKIDSGTETVWDKLIQPKEVRSTLRQAEQEEYFAKVLSGEIKSKYQGQGKSKGSRYYLGLMANVNSFLSKQLVSIECQCTLHSMT
jgi:hypothetical protein